MHLLDRTIPVLLVLAFTAAGPGHSQTTLSLAAAAGPVFFPGSGAGADWHGLVRLGIQNGSVGGRLEAMLTGVPGADLLALTGNLVWIFRREPAPKLEPYLVAGLGTYVKFTEERFGLNGGAGARHRVGPVRLFAEVRYHRVLNQFDEAREADTFVPLLFGITLGR